MLQVDIICGVDHDDLEQLYLVSKTIKEAVSIKINFKLICFLCSL